MLRVKAGSPSIAEKSKEVLKTKPRVGLIGSLRKSEVWVRPIEVS